MKFRPKVVFIIVFVIAFFALITFRAKKLSTTRDEIFKKFDLHFKGIVVSKVNIGHDAARCKIKVSSSNKDEYEGEIWGGLCTLKNDTVYMELIYSHCLKEGDFVDIGPGSHYVIKDFKNRILFDYKKGTDICAER